MTGGPALRGESSSWGRAFPEPPVGGGSSSGRGNQIGGDGVPTLTLLEIVAAEPLRRKGSTCRLLLGDG